MSRSHTVVNKSLTLVGESSNTTIIDGNGTGIVVRINAPDVEFRGFTVQNAGDSPNSSIHLGGCVRDTIRDNVIRNNAYGITLFRSNDSIIVGNEIMNNSLAGIHIRDSSNNIIHYNTIMILTPHCILCMIMARILWRFMELLSYRIFMEHAFADISDRFSHSLGVCSAEKPGVQVGCCSLFG